MSAHRRRRIDRDTAELLLREAAAGRRTGKDALLDVLVAASAHSPGNTGDRILPGEQDAVDVFRAARLGNVAEPPKKSAIQVAVASVLTWKALAAAGITASAVGGAAIMGGVQEPIPTPNEARPLTRAPASAIGNPHPTTGPSNGQDSRPAADGSIPGDIPGTSEQSSQSATPSANASANASAKTASGRASSAVPPSVIGLCRAYEAQARSSSDRLRNPAFASLVQAAGGEQRITTYCRNLLGGSGAADRAASNDSPTSPPTTLQPSTTGDSQIDPEAKRPKPVGKPDTPAGG
jgi:hypothetical protein